MDEQVRSIIRAAKQGVSTAWDKIHDSLSRFLIKPDYYWIVEVTSGPFTEPPHQEIYLSEEDAKAGLASYAAQQLKDNGDEDILDNDDWFASWEEIFDPAYTIEKREFGHVKF